MITLAYFGVRMFIATRHINLLKLFVVTRGMLYALEMLDVE